MCQRYQTRDYEPGDFESLVALRTRLFKDDFILLGLWSDEWNREHLKGMISRNQHWSIVIDSELIGFVQWSQRLDELHVQYLAIAPEFVRLGIGSKVLQELQAKARQDCVPITLALFHNHPEAVAFYQKAGFTVVDTTDRFVRMMWAPESSVRFGKI